MKGIVLSVIKNNIGIYGFIKSDTTNYYYDSSSLKNSIYVKKGLQVEFDVIKQNDGRERAVNVRLADNIDDKKTELLDDSIMVEISRAFAEASNEKGYFASATVPHILKKNGIENFRKYAKNIETFINEIFFDNFIYIKNFHEEEKCYPGIVARKEWAATNGLLEVINNDISDERIDQIRKDIIESSQNDGYMLSSVFPVLLQKMAFVITNYLLIV